MKPNHWTLNVPRFSSPTLCKLATHHPRCRIRITLYLLKTSDRYINHSPVFLIVDCWLHPNIFLALKFDVPLTNRPLLPIINDSGSPSSQWSRLSSVGQKGTAARSAARSGGARERDSSSLTRQFTIHCFLSYSLFPSWLRGLWIARKAYALPEFLLRCFVWGSSTPLF